MKTALITLVLAAILAAGCTTAPKAASPMEQIQAQIKAATAAANAKDIEKFITYFADNFSCEYGDKPAFKDFLVNAKATGYLDGLKIDETKAKTTITGDKALVAPVAIEGNFGNAELTFRAQLVKGVWLITDMEIQPL
jgi:hypothetical protein